MPGVKFGGKGSAIRILVKENEDFSSVATVSKQKPHADSPPKPKRKYRQRKRKAASLADPLDPPYHAIGEYLFNHKPSLLFLLHWIDQGCEAKIIQKAFYLLRPVSGFLEKIFIGLGIKKEKWRFLETGDAALALHYALSPLQKRLVSFLFGGEKSKSLDEITRELGMTKWNAQVMLRRAKRNIQDLL